ncbi:MAG: D-xylose transporter subunit XylF, partial [Verrucomicrobia bacterium]|nr:D-xylose transporter subunit XylF [Verrucomicrobiota bacterium]
MNSRITFVIISFLLSIATGWVISRGNSHQRSGKRVIGLSMDTLKEERWISDRDLFIAQAKALGVD